MTGKDDHPAAPLALDALDQSVLRVLRRAPRATYAQVAAEVGAHERTVARRVERMLGTGRIRFTASLLHEYLGTRVAVRLTVRCAPGHLHETALALARRPDTYAVEVSTGPPVVCVYLTVPDQRDLLAVVDGPIAGLPGVVDIETQVLLASLLTANDWAPYGDEPTPVRRAVTDGNPLPPPLPTDELDERLVALLKEDARMSTSRLARKLRVGETTARRRLSRLLGSHVLHLRLHAEPEALGFPVGVRFRLAVPQRGLDATLRALGREPAVRSLALTSGRYNVFGYSSHRCIEEVHDLSSRAFGAADGVVAETALLIRSYKRVGVLTC